MSAADRVAASAELQDMVARLDPYQRACYNQVEACFNGTNPEKLRKVLSGWLETVNGNNCTYITPMQLSNRRRRDGQDGSDQGSGGSGPIDISERVVDARPLCSHGPDRLCCL
jgi:hypothetical protein